jgi:hypothetical protein
MTYRGIPHRVKKLLDKKRGASLNYHKDCDLFFFFDLFFPIIPLFCYHPGKVFRFFADLPRQAGHRSLDP